MPTDDTSPAPPPPLPSLPELLARMEQQLADGMRTALAAALRDALGSRVTRDAQGCDGCPYTADLRRERDAALTALATRIITYTLDDETGASLRGAGWQREADGITSWWTHPGSRTPAVDRAHMSKRKVRWGLRFRDAVAYEIRTSAAAPSEQLALIDSEAK